jgi:hypothetical protein
LLTVRGSAVVDLAYAEPAMLAAAGMSLNQIAAVERIRQLRPLTPLDFDVRELGDPRGPIRLSVGGASTAYTLRATATLANGQARRTVAALIEQSAVAGPDPIRVVRWYDASL